MHPQAGRLRNGVHQMPERRTPGECEIVALGKPGTGHVARIQPLETLCQRRRIQAGSIDNRRGLQPRAIRRLQLNGSRRTAGAYDRCVAHHHAARMLQIPLQGQHIGVAIHNAGAGRQQGRHACQLRLQRLGLVGVQPLQVVYAIRCSLGLDSV